MIISFYSYKGGVGRSQLCANVASYLCYKKHKKILLLDWDFEAPGLHYFFEKTDKDFKNDGTIELLKQYSGMIRTDKIKEIEDYLFFKESSIVNMIPETAKKGKIDLIPAGNYNQSYVNSVNSFDWFEFYEMLDGKSYIEELKKWLKEQEYDFVFVDSRTGINDYSGICNLHLPDTNVVVMAANDQNIEGCKKIIDQIINSEYTKLGLRKNYVFPVLSRINSVHPNVEYWKTKFTKKFNSLIEVLDNEIDTTFTHEIFRDVYLENTLLNDEPLYSAGENLLIEENTIISQNSFVSKYANLAEYILSINLEGKIGLINQISVDKWKDYAEKAVVENNNEKAAIAYENANDFENCIKYGGSIYAFLYEGNQLLDKGDFENAMESYLKAIKLNNNVFLPYFYLAFIHYNYYKNFKSVVYYLEKAINIQEDVYAFNLLGVSYAELGEIEKSINTFLKGIKLNPDYFDIYINLGNIYFIDNPIVAINYYQKAIDINPNAITAYLNMGLTFEKLKNGNKAKECFYKTIEIEINNYNGNFYLGRVFYEEHNYFKAIEYFEKAKEINPSDFQVFYNLGISYKSINIENSINCFIRTIELKQDYFEAYLNLMEIYKDLSDPENSIYYLIQYIKINPNSHEAYYLLANNYSENNDFEKAIKNYNKSLEIKETSEAYNNLGMVYFNNKKYSESIVHFVNAIKINPDLYNPYHNLGQCYLEKNEYETAIKYYEITFELYPDFYNNLFNLGLSYYYFDNKSKAIEFLYKASLIEKEYEAFYYLGVIYCDMNINDKAIENFKIAFELKPDFDEANCFLGFIYLKTCDLKLAEEFSLKGIELGNKDVGNTNMGHINFIKGNEETSIDYYLLGLEGNEDEDDFWEEMESDFEYLVQYGVSKEKFYSLMEGIEMMIEG